jgi:hypothetical protein
MTDRLWADLELSRGNRADRTGPLARRPPRPTPFALVGAEFPASAGRFHAFQPGVLSGDESEGSAGLFVSTGGDPILAAALNNGSSGTTTLAMHADYRWVVRAPFSAGDPPPCSVQVVVFRCCNGRPVGVPVTATLGAFSVTGTTGPGGYVVLDIGGGGAGTYTISAGGPTMSASTTAVLGCPGGGNLVFLQGPTLPDTLFWTDDLGGVTLHWEPTIHAWAGCAMVPGGNDYCHPDGSGNPTPADFPRSVVVACRSDGTGLGASIRYPAAGTIDPYLFRVIADCTKPLACFPDPAGGGVENRMSCTGGIIDPLFSTFLCQFVRDSGGDFPADAHCETSVYTFTFPPNFIGITSGTLSP